MILYSDLADYYFQIESNHRNIDNDIALIKNLLKEVRKPVLLDLGCGTAEHLYNLSRVGYQCTGLDISKEMLDIAKQKYGNLNLLNQSMTDFDYFEEFDMITCLFGSFDYMLSARDVDNVLWNTWRALKRQGLGIFEIWNAEPIKLIKEKPLGYVSTTNCSNATIVRERGFKISDIAAKIIVDVNYKYTITTNKGVEVKEDYHRMRAFTQDEIEEALKRNGFSIRGFYSNTLLEPLKTISNKMLVIFEKK